MVGRIFFDEIKMTNGFWVSKNTNQFCSPILHYRDLSICVHCMQLAQIKAEVGKDSCVKKLVGGHYSGNLKNLWVCQPVLDKLMHFEN